MADAINDVNNIILGKHIIIDMYNCDIGIINDLDLLQKIIRDTVKCIGSKIVSEGYKVFSPIGISAFAIISESHISIHTWPEYQFAAIDIFSCNKAVTIEICKHIQKALGAERCLTETIDRGKISLNQKIEKGTGKENEKT